MARASKGGVEVSGSTRRERSRPPRSETRRRVLDAAFAVFGERGVAGSSIAEIAEAAGLTKGAIYSNFASKDDLVLALMEEHAMGRLVSALAELTDAPDPQAALSSAGAVLTRALRDDAALHRILAEFFALSHQAPERRDALRRGRQKARAAVAHGIQVWTDQIGLQLPLPPDEITVVLFALSNGLAVESGIDPDAVPDELLGKVLALLARSPD